MVFKKGHKPVRKQPPKQVQQPRPRRILNAGEMLEEMGVMAADLV